MPGLDIDQISVDLPEYDSVKARYDAFHAAYDGAADADARVAALRQWDSLRREYETGSALARLRFNQDTRIEERKQLRKAWEEIEPKLLELELGVKRKLLADPHRPELEARVGPQLFALWESEITTYDPVIEKDVVRESELCAEYTELLASARIDYQGETHNLSGMRRFGENPDRSVRQGAVAKVWGWFGKNAATFDRIFDDLVKLRTQMAKKLGFSDYVEMGYRRQCRVDYDRNDVERYRAAVLEHVVPLGIEIRRAQAKRLGVELRYWDEAIHDPKGNPAPKGDHDWMVERAQEMFDEMGSGLDDFFRLMVGARLTDLKLRDGKAGGGFCTSFPTHGVPFIFANFNGTKGDVEVFTHEMGHAFQNYSSREQFPVDYCWPTAESAEIHSMSLEYLTWPHMEKFFGDDAERFRRTHLTDSILFLPYGVAVDHFQHLIYERPDASPEERHAMWQEVERTYLPWRRFDGVPRLEAGGFWQTQLHIYLHPFYYIDYTLAEVCALQFLKRARADADGAMKDFVQLCRRGGEAPFQELARSAGLKSPFDEGCLQEVVTEARAALG